MTWQSLGTVNPNFLDWTTFPAPAAEAAELFRASYINLPNPVNPYLWVRPIYPDGTVGKATRLYPKNEPQLFEVELPDDFEVEGFLTRSFQVKKASKYVGDRVSDPVWGVTLESWESPEEVIEVYVP